VIWHYIQTINAPHKEFIRFDNSGHFPFLKSHRNVGMSWSSEFCLSPTKKLPESTIIEVTGHK
jgi:hypothetical protein